MEQYQEIRAQVKQHLKGHMISFAIIMILTSFVMGGLQNVIYALTQSQENVYMVMSLLFALIGFFVNNTVFIIFLKRIRNTTFCKKDIQRSAQRIPQHILTGLLLNVFQLLLQMAVTITAVFPPIFYVALSAIVVFMQIWNVCIAFAIYDQNLKILELISGSISLIKTNAKSFCKAACFYFLWYTITQLLITLSVMYFIPEIEVSNHMLSILMTSLDTGIVPFVCISLLYLVAVIGNFVFSIPLFMFTAAVYERNKEMYFPSMIQNRKGDYIENLE